VSIDKWHWRLGEAGCLLFRRLSSSQGNTLLRNVRNCLPTDTASCFEYVTSSTEVCQPFFFRLVLFLLRSCDAICWQWRCFHPRFVILIYSSHFCTSSHSPIPDSYPAGSIQQQGFWWRHFIPSKLVDSWRWLLHWLDSSRGRIEVRPGQGYTIYTLIYSVCVMIHHLKVIRKHVLFTVNTFLTHSQQNSFIPSHA